MDNNKIKNEINNWDMNPKESAIDQKMFFDLYLIREWLDQFKTPETITGRYILGRAMKHAMGK